MGYLYISINDGYPERFINLCKNNDIYIWNLKNIGGQYQFEMLAKDYKKLKTIAKKSHTLPWIDKKIGLPFTLHKYRKRKAFVLGLFIFALIIYMLSLNIWNISVNGGRTYTKETILQFLETQDVYVGKKIKDIDCRAIEENIRESYTDIGWVSAEIKGTNLIINLKETTLPSSGKKGDRPSHIVASKNGIITETVIRSGTPMVNVGDVVKKGDILISGVVEVIGDNDLLVSKEPVMADGDIQARTYYEYKDKFPLKTTEKEYTNNSKTKYGVKILSKVLNLYKYRIPYERYDIITEEIIFQPVTNFYFPLSIIKLNLYEYIEVEKIYTENEAKDLAKTRLNRVLRKLEENDVIIQNNSVKFQTNKKSCTATGNIVVEESIIDYKIVNEHEWRMETEDELIGDDN